MTFTMRLPLHTSCRDTVSFPGPSEIFLLLGAMKSLTTKCCLTLFLPQAHSISRRRLGGTPKAPGPCDARRWGTAPLRCGSAARPGCAASSTWTLSSLTGGTGWSWPRAARWRRRVSFTPSSRAPTCSTSTASPRAREMWQCRGLAHREKPLW